MRQSLALRSDHYARLLIILVPVAAAVIVWLWLAAHGAFSPQVWAQETL